MLLQKTSWRIKNFISHRRQNSQENSGHICPDECFADPRLSINTPKRLSWLSQTSIEMQPSLRRASSNATPRSHEFLATATTAHSSASSFCSCDYVVNAASTEFPLSKTNRASNSPPEVLCLPQVSSIITLDEAKPWKLVTLNLQPRSPTTYISKSSADIATGTNIGSGLTFDLLEALSIDPNDINKTPTQSLRNKESADMVEMSDNVEQLIRETDQAFQAVGTALAEAKEATTGWYDNPRPAPDIHSFPITQSASKNRLKPPIFSQKSSVVKSKSVKGKTNTAKRKPGILSRTKAWRKPLPRPTITPSRWALTEATTNMADTFGERMFRTEVNEMLTLGRIEQIKQDNIEVTQRESMESSWSFDTAGSTPTEPFHLEGLSARIKAAQMATSPMPKPCDPVTKLTTPPSRPKRPNNKLNLTTITASNVGMTINGITFPSPPRTPRRPSSSKNAPLLPTIPEISPFHISPSQFFNPQMKAPLTPPITPSANFITLPSTPFTVISPLFRHGKIRLSYIHPIRNDTLPEDEALDWTSFQIAIAGKMDEYGLDTRDEEQWEKDEMELDELMEWWAGFGFTGWGKLVGGFRADTTEKIFMCQKLKSHLDFGAELPKPETQNISKANDVILTGEKMMLEDKSLGADVGKLVVSRRPSIVESLPPSPMLDLSYLSTAREEVVPMGFNLGHDLGDFLNWGTKNVQTFVGNK